MRATFLLIASIGFGMLTATPVAAGPGFLGDGRCGNPTCHGAGLPNREKPDPKWRPWKSARTQWINTNIDRHSRAYRTLETDEGRTIARYMGIEATQSDKCLACHAPAATAAPGGRYKKSDGVTCEHCHGPAELWLEPHSQKDWPQTRRQYVSKGFYDNDDYVLRARNCARCHVAIDHEIVAGGHPPLQFELVAYAQIMKHWDDQDELPAGAFSVDPTIWALGQVTGLRDALRMLSERADGANYQSFDQFPHFADRNCYTCHHKLVDDALRQARGHYLMVDAVLSGVATGKRDELAGLWNAVAAAVPSSPQAAKQKADAMIGWLGALEGRLDAIDQSATRRMLARVTAGGDRLKLAERFSFSRSKSSNCVDIDNPSTPWWWTTGGPEQSYLAIRALCRPAWGDRCDVVKSDMRTMLDAIDRFAYKPDQFAASLGAVGAKLK
ncbi:MAG: hypothetical protein IT294_13490 [Deltaproteobacteria bacterium]|nr:hypothetical protein [Deltaproteobacteria bacterium]